MKIESRLWLDSMPSLSVLTLARITSVEDVSGSVTEDSNIEQENVAQSHFLQPLKQVQGRPSLDQEGTISNSRTGLVRGEGVVDASRILHLNGLVKLQNLTVEYSSVFEEIEGLDALGNLQKLTVRGCRGLRSLDGLSGLVQLHVLRVMNCKSLRKLPDMSSLTCLEMLEVAGNEAMEEVGSLSCTLKDVRVGKCPVLRRMPDVSSLTCLENLKLKGNEAMEEVGGLSCTLKHVKILSCPVVKRMPDMSTLTCLETLMLYQNEAMEEVGGLSCTLKGVWICGCPVLKRIPDVSNLTRLESLELTDNKAMEEVGGDYFSSTLKRLLIVGCVSLTSCPSLDECMHMKELRTGCAHHISSLQKLPNLRVLYFDGYGGSPIKKIDVGTCLTDLNTLRVSGCGALEEIGDLGALSSLEYLNIWDCPRLKKLNVGCASLKTLHLIRCNALEEILNTLPSLKDVEIEDCPSLKKSEVISSTPPPDPDSERL